MRVLFVSRDFLPSIGGVSLMVHGLAEACVQLGHNVTVLAPHCNDRDPFGPQPYRIIRDARLRPARGRRLASLKYVHDTRREIRRVVQEIAPNMILLGVYHTYAAACLKEARRLGIVIGGLVHGNDVLSALTHGRSRIRALAGKAIGFPTAQQHALMYLRGADRIFANSSVTSHRLAQRTGRRPVTIGCGVSGCVAAALIGPQESSADRAAARARLGLAEAPTVGFLGRLVARKNVETVMRSLEELKDCNALIVGSGPQRGALQALADRVGVNERVTFVGQVDESQKQDYFRAMDVFCLPSKEIGGYDIEGFGIVLLEATAAGVPVVGGRSGGIPDVIQHEHTGLLADPNDWRDVARCIRRILNDHQLAANCVSAAQARLRSDFNWAVIAQRMLSELVAAMIEKRPTGQAGRY